jgi:hypothetical protein
MTNQNCTIYKNIFAKKAYHLSVEECLERIKNGKSKDLIETIRVTLDKDRSSEMKRNLPSVCFSGIFESERKDDLLVKHSGYIILDFDDVEDVETYKHELFAHKFIKACWISPSGNGVKALVKIASSDKHREHFMALQEQFPLIDRSGVNPSRVCYESYDPEIFVRDEVEPFTKIKTIDRIVEKTIESDAGKTFDKILKWLTNKGDAFVTGERNLFIFKLASACCRFGLSDYDTERFIHNSILINDNSFSGKEATQAIQSAFKSNANKAGSAYFEKDILIERTSREEIKLDEKFFDVTVRPKDVLFGEDVKEDAMKLYDFGYESAETTEIPELDVFWKWKKGELTLLSGIGNYGKALDIETDIPTPDGLKKMKDLKVGDRVFDENGKPCNVINATDVMLNRNCFKVLFNDGTEVIADENHLWLTDTVVSRRSIRNSKKNNRFFPRELKNKGVDQTHKREFESVKTTLDISKSLVFDGEYNHSVKKCKPVEYPEVNHSIHPYVFGCWIGDGHSSGGGFTCNDEQIIQKIQQHGENIKKNKPKYGYYIKGLKQRLRVVGVFENKHIPDEYLYDSVENRMDLLRGLMDTDGYVSKKSICEFTTIKKHLAEQVYFLICSLGIKATIYEADAKLYGRIVSKKYRITFCTTEKVFYLDRKLERLKDKIKNENRTIFSCTPCDSVPVRCIEVDSSSKLFLCTKSHIPTHNSSFLKYILLMKSIKKGWKWALFAPEDFPAHEFYHDIVEMYIGHDMTPRNFNRQSRELYEQVYDWVSKHFFFVYPKEISSTPDYIKERFLELIIKEQVNGVVIDPFNQMDNDYSKVGGRDDKYLEIVLSDFKRFAQVNDIPFLVVAHPKLIRNKDPEGNYECPDVFDIAGGAMNNNKYDNIMIYHRPLRHSDPQATNCELHTKKIKRQKIVGSIGVLNFNLKKLTRRYLFESQIDYVQQIVSDTPELEPEQTLPEVEDFTPPF